MGPSGGSSQKTGGGRAFFKDKVMTLLRIGVI
jgi:hypothetical protein